MNKIDILEEVYLSRLSPEAADNVVDNIIGSSAAGDIEAMLMLSKYEWTAYCQGAPLEKVAHWRYEGWPDVCVLCGLNISIGNFGWMVVDGSDGFALRHIVCPI